MSSRVDSAIPTRLSSIRKELIGKKLRVVGKVLSHDIRSSTILLWNDCHIVLADISLCLPTRGSVSWLREPGSTITLFGYLEQTQAPHTRQTETRLADVLPAQLPREDVVLVPHVSLQAILVLDSPDVDIRLWNATVAEMETSGKLPRLLRAPALLRWLRPSWRELRADVRAWLTRLFQRIGVLGEM